MSGDKIRFDPAGLMEACADFGDALRHLGMAYAKRFGLQKVVERLTQVTDMLEPPNDERQGDQKIGEKDREPRP